MSQEEPGDATPAVTPQALALGLGERYDATSHPQELLDIAEFERGVALLCESGVPIGQLIDHLLGANHALAAMAAEALARREDGAEALPAFWRFFGDAPVWTLFFMLRALARHAREPVVGKLMLVGAEWWPRHPVLVRMLNHFVTTRARLGESVEVQSLLANGAPTDVGELEARLACLEPPHGPRLCEELRAWQRARLDVRFLGAVGRVWTQDDGAAVLEHDALKRALDAALLAIGGDTPRSVLVQGEAGVGKTTLVRALGERLGQRGWRVFQASAADIMAGQTYIGELEGRLRDLIAHLAVGKRVIWYVPAFHELYYAGRHRYSPVGALDILLPAMERGEICLVGEVEPHALEKVLQQRPRLRQCVHSIELEALSSTHTQALAERYLARAEAGERQRADAETVREAIELACQYLSNRVLPGSALELLRDTLARVVGEGAGGRLTREALLTTLARQTGLPVSVLDERAGLDPPALRLFFQQRVMGQPEAVDCLVDRIAMLKAGLTDPARPVGVFLFAGPTGTGKTEVAKSLAQFLFGSADRMIRLDMSELQESGSLTRLIGDGGEGGESTALTNRVRKQPFSVVLLDEFEKAHPRVWDLFLQVFDDGRLTDAQGNLADFRHSIIILTTNVGATEHQGASLGFTSAGGEFGEQQVTRAVSRTFRPEFVNRLDRVIVFRPLTKPVMREILKKELRAVLQRRGLRNRDWAVEWEESAIDFLLEKGFTPDMGARPLRRAIDRYVLAPLANTIVERRAPEGDQFLFVRAGADALEVEFVDPDAPASGAPAALPETALDVRDIALAPAGSETERHWLAARLDEIEARIDGAEWQEAKAEWLRQMQRPEFWRDAQRHAVLLRIEGMDAIEAATQSARSLSRRLEPRAGRAGAPRGLLGTLAQQIYLLQMALPDAGTGHDVFIGIELSAAQANESSESSWLRQLAEMYLAWGRRRHMRVQRLEEGTGRRWVLAVSGLGAARILAGESGLHVLEQNDAAGSAERVTARVRVALQPAAPAPRGQAALAQALQCLEAMPAEMRVTRRYRVMPSPLVRDLVAGWRSGRLESVLGGDFDLMRASGDDD